MGLAAQRSHQQSENHGFPRIRDSRRRGQGVDLGMLAKFESYISILSKDTERGETTDIKIQQVPVESKNRMGINDKCNQKQFPALVSISSTEISVKHL